MKTESKEFLGELEDVSIEGLKPGDVLNINNRNFVFISFFKGYSLHCQRYTMRLTDFVKEGSYTITSGGAEHKNIIKRVKGINVKEMLRGYL